MNRNIKKVSFEEAMNELKEIVNRMHNGNMPLESLIQCYEDGLKLKQHAYSLLNTAKIKIEKTSNSINHIIQARSMGYTGEFCVTCNSLRMVRDGTCSKCCECGQTNGC